MNSEVFGFEEMALWKKVRIFKNEIQVLTKQFPTDEKFRLTDQMIKCPFNQCHDQ